MNLEACKKVGNCFLIANNLYKTYPGGHIALKGVSLTVRQKETVVIIGPSGSGKSTLLRALCGLETIDSGDIIIGDLNLSQDLKMRHKMRPELGMVFQSFNLFPHLTALENITLAPIKVRKLKANEAKNKALELLETVGLSDKAASYPSQLSGGQQQRVAIARALAMDPSLMFFDEATSALDPEMIGEVLTVMKKLSKSGATMIVVTHEMGFAKEAGDRIVFMEDGQIQKEATSEDFFTSSSSERIAAFLGNISH